VNGIFIIIRAPGGTSTTISYLLPCTAVRIDHDMPLMRKRHRTSQSFLGSNSVDVVIELVKFGNYRSHYQCIYENVKTQQAEDTSTFEMLATISFNGPVFLYLQSTDESLQCGSSMWQYKVELSENLFHRLDPVPANKAVFSVQ